MASANIEATINYHDRREAELIERFDLERNDTEDSRSRATLIEYVGTEAGQAFQAERKVEFEAFFKAVLLRISHYAIGQLLGLGRRHLRQV